MPNVSEFTQQNRLHAANTKKLLSSGFLDTLGGSRSSFNPSAPVEWNALEEVLIKYGEKIVAGFAEELAKSNANASGFLTDSLRFEFSKAGKSYEVSVYMADYAKFVDEGVQGISKSKSINRTSPYRFKFANPSEKHLQALEKWIREKNVTAIITVPKGIANEASKVKSLAYAIGRATKQRGLKATYFKKKVIESIIDELKAEVAKAAGDDMKINITF